MQAEAKQKELYLSMRELREQQRRAKEEEERRMDVNFAQQEAAARKAGAFCGNSGVEISGC